MPVVRAQEESPIDLVGLLPADLVVLTTSLDAEPFRANQLWHWIYHRGVTDFSTMTNLPETFRKKLSERCVVGRPQISQTITAASDFTHKWLMRFPDGKEVETVYIPKDNRGTLCLSSQIGCTLACRFCYTGTQKLTRNLSAAEIVGQVLKVNDVYNCWKHSCCKKILSNVVMMGMGEPLLNYNNVITALKILTNIKGLAVSQRRVTVSTAGVVPMIQLLGKEISCNLSISLHAATDAVRDVLMPINKRYPLAALMAACRGYQAVRNAHRITFEYIMLRGINDSEADARAIVRLVNGLHCKFNLIPFNQWPGAPYACSTADATYRFATILRDSGYAAPIRAARGRDIHAACGQLCSAFFSGSGGSESEREWTVPNVPVSTGLYIQ